MNATPAIHFVGVGGVGMAGLARLYALAGYRVSGSDAAESRLTRALADLGCDIRLGHAVSHVPAEVDWAVRTPAVDETNPEVAILRERGVPVFARGAVLAAYANRRRTLAVAGAHGKTTTSAMLATILRDAGTGAGYAIGGETALPGGVSDPGHSDWFVIEADESDGTLVDYAPAVGVLSCVEWDHVERFATEEALLACYRFFAERCGSLWRREDDTAAARVSAGLPRVGVVGESASADLQLLEAQDDAEGQSLRVAYRGGVHEGRLPLPGRHNAWNALLAMGAATEAGVCPGAALRALAGFRSVGRRFERVNVGGITLLHDYAHHPTELRALLDSARALHSRRIRLVFQPHRYSRTRHLLDGFADALAAVDDIHLLPVYAASEHPSQGMESDALATRISQRHPSVQVRLWEDMDVLAGVLAAELAPGDLCVIAGAGDISGLVDRLTSRLAP